MIKTRKFRDKKNISYKKLSVEQTLKTETLGKPPNLASELLHGKKKVRNYQDTEPFQDAFSERGKL